jgi:hypothetical protein
MECEIVDFTPGRSHVEPARRGKGPKGQPRSGWLQRLGEHDQLVQWLKPLTQGHLIFGRVIDRTQPRSDKAF